MKRPILLSLIPSFLLLTPPQATAILLDCEIRSDGLYQCIEVGRPAPAAPAEDGEEEYGETYRTYREQARSQCSYQEPRKRAGGKNTGAAQRTEALKAARKDYEDCVNNKARALWRQHKAREN